MSLFNNDEQSVEFELDWNKISVTSIDDYYKHLNILTNDLNEMQSVVNVLQSGNSHLDKDERLYYIALFQSRINNSKKIIDKINQVISMKELGVT